MLLLSLQRWLGSVNFFVLNPRKLPQQMVFLLVTEKERTNAVMGSEWLQLACESRWLNFQDFYKLVVKHLGSLILVTAGVFTPQKLANTTNEGFF